jgi:hypothetical protein
VHGGEHDATALEQHVLHVARVPGVVRLRPDRQATRAERASRLGVEQLAEPLEPLGRQVRPVVDPVAVRPVVVPGGEDERVLEPVVERDQVGEAGVVAGLRPALDVTGVQHEAHLRVGVDVVAQGREGEALGVAVGRVAEQGERRRARGADGVPRPAVGRGRSGQGSRRDDGGGQHGRPPPHR